MFRIKPAYFFSANTAPFSAVSAVKFFFFTFFLASCAQVVAPGGGLKDTTPPKVLKYRPDSAQLNFNSKNIQVDFDEFIVLKDLSNQLLISPPLSKAPDIMVKNKMLNITFDKNEVLRPNTTYSISFGDAIQDLNENNALKDFRYIFSTGNFIDSLSLEGKVQDAFYQSTSEGIVVMLYSDLSDSAVFKTQPDYFAKTKKDGTFRISNIRSGKYKLAAVKDVNANYRYDGESEMIGFVEGMLDVSEKKSILIDLFQEPAKKIYLKKYIHDSYGKVSMFFNQGSDSLHVTPLNNDQKGVQEYLDFSKNNDTLTYWIKNFVKDSLILQVRNGNKVIDTLEIKFISKEDALKSKKNPFKLKVISSPDGSQGFDLGSDLVIRFNHYIGWKLSAIGLKEDSTQIITKYGKPLLGVNSSQGVVSLMDSTTQVEDMENPGTFITAPVLFPYNEWKENTSYHLFIPPGTFEDFFGLPNDSIRINFKTREEKYYGSVKVLLPELTSDFRHILQLVDEGGKVVREAIIRAPGSFEFQYLHPGKYRLKIIWDDNDNGKWDSGNYLEKKQPERVVYDAELINIRSNWDAELEWKVSDFK